MNRYFFNVFLFFSCFLSMTAQDTISFDRCLDIAFKNNLKIKEALNNEELSLINLKKMKGSYLPNVYMNFSNTNSLGRNIDPDTNTFSNSNYQSFSGGIFGNFMIFNGLYKVSSVKQAKKDVSLNNTIVENIKNELSIEIATIYTSILNVEEQKKINLEHIELSKKELEFMTLKLKEGKITESEMYRIMSKMATEKSNLLLLENSLSSLFLDLNLILNFPIVKVTSLKPFDFTIVGDEFAHPLNLEDIYLNNPISKISAIKEEQANLNISMNRSRLWPSLSLDVGYNSFYSNTNKQFSIYEQFDNNRNFRFLFTLSIPIFNGFNVRNSIREAKKIHSNMEIQTNLEKNIFFKIITKANVDLVFSYEKLHTIEEALILSEKVFKVDQVKFEYGKLSLVDLLSSQKIFYNNKSDFIRAKYEYIYNRSLINFYKYNTFIFPIELG